MTESWKIGDLFQIKTDYWRESVFVVTNIHSDESFDMICLYDDTENTDYKQQEKFDWYYNTWYHQKTYNNWIKL